MSQWQPIETAPRDGSIFLASNESGYPFPVVYLIRETKFDEPGLIGRLLGRKPRQTGSGLYLYGALPVGGGAVPLVMNRGWKPTHWMPLPPPPQQEEGQNRS